MSIDNTIYVSRNIVDSDKEFIYVELLLFLICSSTPGQTEGFDFFNEAINGGHHRGSSLMPDKFFYCDTSPVFFFFFSIC